MKKNIKRILKSQRIIANELRKSSQYSNICFITRNNGRVKADKSYLCTFEWRYKGKLENNANPDQRIELNNSPCKIYTDQMEKIIDFIYTGKFDFRMYEFSEIIQFHQISKYLMIDFLSGFLKEFILKNFQGDRKKCLDLWNYAKKMGLRNWENQVLDYIARNAKKFLRRNVFLEHTQYLEILEHKELKLDDNTLCRYLLKWYDHDIKKRRLHLKDLFDKIDINNLNEDMLLSLVSRKERTFDTKVLENLRREYELKRKLKILDWDSS